MSEFDAIVVGGGLRGLTACLRRRHERPGERLLVVEARSAPGGSVRTQRSNGFVCELGTFAFTNEELDSVLPLLTRPPRIVPCEETARAGLLFDGQDRQPARLASQPLSFPTGCEDLVQAIRREVDEQLRLGRAVSSIEPADAGFTIELGGEVPTRLTTAEVVVAIPSYQAAPLLAAFDPALADVATRIEWESRAFVWFGCGTNQATDMTGYGMLATDDLASPIAELIFCTEVFPNRAMPGRFLVRAELPGPEVPTDDGELLELAEAELRRWTGTQAAFGFTKIQRFSTAVADGTSVECRTRLIALAERVPGITLAP